MKRYESSPVGSPPVATAKTPTATSSPVGSPPVATAKMPTSTSSSVGSPPVATASNANYDTPVVTAKTPASTSSSVGSPPVATDVDATCHDADAAHAVATGGDPTKTHNLGRLNQLARLTVATGGDPTETHNLGRLNQLARLTVATGGDPTLPDRKYPRANFHDYNGGVYFVTVCTMEKIHYFGEIHDGVMHLSLLGRCLTANLNTIQSHHKDVEIPLFVVMPNHFHAIVYIDGGDPTKTHNLGRLNQLARLTVATGGDPTLSTHHSNRLSVVITGIKAHVSRFARRNGVDFAWQCRYHDHIIRNTRGGNNIAEYIENNVAHWDTDCFYS